MRFRWPLALKFILPSTILLAALGAGLYFELANIIEQSLVRQAAGFVVDFVQLQAEQHGIKGDDFSLENKDRVQRTFDSLFAGIHTKDIIRIKVWDNKHTVIYSDDQAIVGQQFRDNDELNEALEGEPQTEISKAAKTENASENQYGDLLEIYIPIKSNGQVVGVIETYYQLAKLQSTLAMARQTLLISIGGVFLAVVLVILLLIGLLILKPIGKLRQATNKIAAGHFGITIPIKSRDEIGNLANSFRAMSEKLAKLEELRNEFFFVAVHEIRAPITALSWYVQLIRAKPTNSEEYLSEIELVNDRLKKLVGNLMDMARTETGKIEFNMSTADIGAVCQKACDSLATSAAAKNITIEYRSPKTAQLVQADQARLEEIVTNLVSSALEDAPEGSPIQVWQETEGGDVVTHVRRSGPALSKEIKSHLFERFYLSKKDLDSGTTGTILDMYITKELVERMGGRISFVTQEGQTTYSFRLLKRI